jgi:hypothetical protein
MGKVQESNCESAVGAEGGHFGSTLVSAMRSDNKHDGSTSTTKLKNADTTSMFATNCLASNFVEPVKDLRQGGVQYWQM